MLGGITATGLYVTGTGLGGAGLARTLSRADLGVYGGMYFFLPGSSLGASVIISLGLLHVSPAIEITKIMQLALTVCRLTVHS